jgi:2-polyprenyl-3-methyl-5-hydroxy-6-metoxy-1,4-benzoquinol methylase
MSVKLLSQFPGLKLLRKKILIASLNRAIREQHLADLALELERIVPDITFQYSCFNVDTPYIYKKVRYQHAFQISLVDNIIYELNSPFIVDIGDSCGTHLQYLKNLYHDKGIKTLSINLDGNAVKKIKAKGLDAIHSRAEDLESYNVKADIFLCFETLEHLMDPCHFLRNLSSKTKVKYLIITVPFLRKSRVGLRYIRNAKNGSVCAENTHIFELNPEDWKLIAKHSGWDIVEEKTYLQYPRKSFLKLTKIHWKKFDFEGFYGMVLKRDNSWSSRYQDW